MVVLRGVLFLIFSLPNGIVRTVLVLVDGEWLQKDGAGSGI